MINLRENMTSKNIALTLVVIVVLMAAQFGVMKLVKNANTEVQGMKLENKTTDRALQRRTDQVMKLKAALRFDHGLIPDEVPSPTIFYGDLAKMLNSSGLSGATISKSAEADKLVSFKVSGTGQYFSLLDALASLRQSGKMLRLTYMSVTGGKTGLVDYSFTVQAQAAKVEQPQSGGGAQ